MFNKKLLPIKFLNIILIWLGIALLYGGQRYIQFSLDGEQCHFLRTIFEHVPTFLSWAFLAPLIQYRVLTNPIINSTHKFRDLFAHFMLATLLSLTVLAVIGYFRWIYYRPYNGMGWLEYLRNFMLLWFLYQYFLYGSMLVFLLALNYYHKFKNQEKQALQLERHLVESQLKVLKSQLHPHFLFNTLNSISMLIRLDNKEDANSTISLLGDLLRQILQKKETQFTTLVKEIEFIEKYLKIESIRFQDNFSYSITLPTQAYNFLVPDMILHPIVENSIKHGFGNTSKTLKLSIAISIIKDGIEIIIEDNGLGFNLEETIGKKSGIGLKNVFDRCQKIYSKNCITIHSKPGVGTKVILEIPATK